MSQEELAEKLGVSRQTISNWENGKAVLDAEKLAVLCAVFEVSADDMLNGDGLPIAQHKTTPSQHKGNRRLIAIIFSVIALAFIVIAAIGLIVTEDKVSISSLITFHSDVIWIALFLIGGVSLVSALVILFKK